MKIYDTTVMSDTLQIQHVGSVALIRLNRPQVYNSFNREMALACKVPLTKPRLTKTFVA